MSSFDYAPFLEEMDPFLKRGLDEETSFALVQEIDDGELDEKRLETVIAALLKGMDFSEARYAGMTREELVERGLCAVEIDLQEDVYFREINGVTYATFTMEQWDSMLDSAILAYRAWGSLHPE